MFKKLVYRWLYPACTFFSLFVLAVLSITTLASSGTSTLPALRLIDTAPFLFISIILPPINMLLGAKKLNTVLRVTLHFTALIASFGVVFWMFGKNKEFFSPSALLLFLMILAVCYFFVMFVVMLIKSHFKGNGSESAAYTKIYKK